MANLVPIGRFSKMTRLSVKALRHYDELGLLVPAVVDLPLPPAMLDLVQHAKAYERLAIEAAVTGDRTTALKALLANPLGPGADRAQGLLDALLEENRASLPRFFPAA